MRRSYVFILSYYPWPIFSWLYISLLMILLISVIITIGMNKSLSYFACQIYLVECVSKIKHILSVIHYTICGAICFQFTHFPCDDWENINILSNYHHQIGSMNYYPLFRIRPWNNCARCMSFYILINIKMSTYQYRKSHCGDKMVVRSSYLNNGISYTGKRTSLYWIRTQDMN